jgi:hypothetical protein
MNNDPVWDADPLHEPCTLGHARQPAAATPVVPSPMATPPGCNIPAFRTNRRVDLGLLCIHAS